MSYASGSSSLSSHSANSSPNVSSASGSLPNAGAELKHQIEKLIASHAFAKRKPISYSPSTPVSPTGGHLSPADTRPASASSANRSNGREEKFIESLFALLLKFNYEGKFEIDFLFLEKNFINRIMRNYLGSNEVLQTNVLN